jgi:hypothetical protein
MAPKKPRNVYTLVCGDDWQGLYLNDELVIEDHRVRVEDALNAVIQGGGISEFSWRDCDYEWLSDVGNLPKSLTDVKFLAE